jgi:hypothetical protein
VVSTIFYVTDTDGRSFKIIPSLIGFKEEKYDLGGVVERY